MKNKIVGLVLGMSILLLLGSYPLSKNSSPNFNIQTDGIAAVGNQEMAGDDEFTPSDNPFYHVSLQDSTVSLLNIAHEFKNSPPGKKALVAARLADYAQARKALVLKAMDTNPNLLFQTVPHQDTLPSDIASLVEQRRQIKGTFEYLHIHKGDFDSGLIEDQFYVVENSTGKRYKIHTKAESPALTGDEVTVDGIVLDTDIAAHDKSIKVTSRKITAVEDHEHTLAESLSIPLAHAQTATSLKKKVAVIMFNWQNDTRTIYTEATARDAFFTGTGSANSFYKENSYGKEELVGNLRTDGDVFGWVTLPYDNTDCANQWNNWAVAADAQLRAQGVDLSAYNIRTYVFPNLSSCGWAGLGYVGGNPSTSYINGATVKTITHELGHNLGLQHAGSWACKENGIAVAISSDVNCVFSEYGDMFGVMGGFMDMRHISNYQKGIAMSTLNWLDSTDTLTVNRQTAPSGSYELVPTEQNVPGTQVLRIPRTVLSTGFVSDYYYVEFRQPVGFDRFIDPKLTNGVIIRIASDYNQSTKGKLIDATPETDVFTDAPLLVGKTFTDPINSIYITPTAVSASGATVNVSFSAPPVCTKANPTFVVTPTSSSLLAGQSASFNYTLTNNNGGSCGAATFAVNLNLPPGFPQSPTSNTQTLASGASVSGSFIVTTSSVLAPAQYSLTASAQNTVDTSFMASNPLVITILPTDGIPPVVQITSPLSGATVSKGKMKISASATDASGIAELSLSLDGVVLKKCYTAACSISINIASFGSGMHTVTATSLDKAIPANTATSVRSFTKK